MMRGMSLRQPGRRDDVVVEQHHHLATRGLDPGLTRTRCASVVEPDGVHRRCGAQVLENRPRPVRRAVINDDDLLDPTTVQDRRDHCPDRRCTIVRRHDNRDGRERRPFRQPGLLWVNQMIRFDLDMIADAAGSRQSMRFQRVDFEARRPMRDVRHSPAARGAVAFVRRTVRRRGPVGVLAYHSISSVDVDPWNLSVSATHFERQIGVLLRTGSIVTADVIGALGMVSRLSGSSPRYAITFDDGYADNLFAALPILERFDAPATVFVISGCIGDGSFWWDDLAGLTYSTGATCAALTRASIRCGLLEGETFDENERCDRDNLHAALHSALATLPTARIKLMLGAIAELAGTVVPVPTTRPLSHDELAMLAAHPLISIGAHTATHPRLTAIEPSAAVEEIREGKADLDRLLGHQSRPLAYPYGDTDETIADIARSLGFVHAYTTNPRYHSLRPDRLLLPRLHPHDVGDVEFERWLTDS